MIFLLFTINSYQTLDKQNARCLLKKGKLFSAEDYKRNLTQTDLSKQREDETDLSAAQDHEKRLGAPVSVVFSPTTSVRTGCISYQCALPSAVKARRTDHVSFDHRVWDTLIKHTMNRGSRLTLNSYFLSLPRFPFPTFSDASSVNLCRCAIIMGPHHFYWALQEGFTAISATKYWQQFFWRCKTTSILALTNNPPSSVREQWIRD